ncbi:hypothetical protein HELRODRAFT_95956 [Helobdella robusta]|uniref:Sulfatase N-terminal domain-containing protein n=1 Tax=Helobdella robusta TaxID=6412 RepID=T1G991_HELRO|nr:hypothetical protein HELRODRAFT_95956 [Helobdella robusta]ESN92640.1 hypothetical protein HELRODRAFT_95956 [Helobdella robusta]
MIMDDMGWGDLGCYGNPSRETPNLDRMASEGVLFTDMYAASAICSPSRASLLTGRLPVRNGFYSLDQARNSYAPQEVIGGIQESEVLISELLRTGGYKNKIIGKWHLGHRPEYLPLKHGFDEWLGAPNCHYRYDNKYIPNIPFFRDDHMIGRLYYDEIEIDDKLGLSNLTQVYIEDAIEFIQRQSLKKQPFFLYWTPDGSHTPLYVSPKFRNKSKRGLYGDVVMELDYGVGRILEALRKLRIENDTFVLFSSDNGAATYAFDEGFCYYYYYCYWGSNGPFLCGKQTTFEGGMREPAIAWWPGKIKPKLHTGAASLMDILPTLADLAGVEVPKNLILDGESLKDVLLGDNNNNNNNNNDDNNNKDNVNDVNDEPIFYYRGNTLFNIRWYGPYKAHYYTWATPTEAKNQGYEYCPGQQVDGVTTSNMTDHSKNPILFHLGRDPGEKMPINVNTNEYRDTVVILNQVLKRHEESMEFGKAQLEWCDQSVQNWSPPGCEKINQCLPAPLSQPYRCAWPY